jgi:UPF0716 protein FxsA
MGRLLTLLVLVPMLELLLLIEIGERIGFAATIGLIVVTGVIGASLARWQGLGVLRSMREEQAAGRIPAGQIVDGVMILVAGAVLMTPGVLTDAFGFLLLVPAFRSFCKRHLRQRFERPVERGTVKVNVDLGRPGPRTWSGPREVKDVTPPKRVVQAELTDRPEKQ